MKSKKTKKITDELIGCDEKVCSCSVRIAELISSGNEKGEDPSLAQTLATLRRKKDNQQAE